MFKNDKQERREKVFPCICNITHLLGEWKCEVYAQNFWLIVKDDGEEKLAGMLTDLTIWSGKPR